MNHRSVHTEKGSAEYINRLNKIAVLNLIRQEGRISRAEIVKRTGLSAPTVTRIVDSLINNEGLAVQEGIGESSGGRPPVIVRFNGVTNFVIGIDWGRTHINGVVANLNAEILLNIDEPIRSDTDFEHDLNRVVDMINKLISRSNINPNKLLGIGVAAAGYVNFHSGTIEFSPNFGWSKVNLKQSLSSYFQIPVAVENVSRVMALGELWYGVGHQLGNFLFVNVGYGIGSGLIVDHKPVPGYDGYCGEIGHTRLLVGPSVEQRHCVCGKTDCLECYVSGRGIAETAKQRIRKEPSEILNSLVEGNPERITTEILAQAAAQGDPLAISIFEEAAEILGIAFANFSNAFNPNAVVLGGKVTRAGNFFVTKIKEVFEAETLQHVSRPVKLLTSSIPGEEAVKGAIALVLKEVLELNITSQ